MNENQTIWDNVLFFFLQFIVFFFWFIFISWRLITLQYCSGFCHTWDKVSNTFPISLSIFQPSFSAVVGSLSCVRLFATPQTPLSFSLSWSLFRFVSIDSVMVEVGLKFVSFHLVIILVHASVFNIWMCFYIYIFNTHFYYAKSCKCFHSSPYIVCILQARLLEWAVISSSRVFFWPGDKHPSLASPEFAGRFLTTLLPRKPNPYI